jgi:hypothetical protein
MTTTKTSFRMDARTLKLMDKLLKSPPEAVIDPVLGWPRNRTELVKRLIEAAADLGKPADPGRRPRPAGSKPATN